MSRDSRPVSRSGVPAAPVLVHCDRSGRVLWMSERSRRRLGGEPEALSGFALAICGRQISKTDSLSIRFTRVFETQSTAVIAIELQNGGGEMAELVGLLGLNRRLLLHTAQLERACRFLALHASRRGAGAGRRLVEQVDLERQRLGRELHTGVGQLLAALRMQLELAESSLAGIAPPARAALDRAVALSARAADQVRAVSHRLHPPEWQRLEIADALAQLWELSGIPEKFEARLRIEPIPSEPSLAVKVLLYRAAQEALSNVIQHSGASRVEMTFEARDGRVRLTVADNGSGFDLDRILQGAVSLRAGIGLRAIREQVHALGGEFNVTGGPRGAMFEVALPAAGDVW